MGKYLLIEKQYVELDGECFCRKRKAKGKLLRDIAESTGLSVSYLCDIENGRRIAKDEVANKIVEALDK